MDKNKKRPVYLNLFKIRMPVMAVLSIAHRITGVLMALLIPAFIYLFSLSVSDQQGFSHVLILMNTPLMKGVLLLTLWGLALHFFSGLRFLLIDFEIGVDKQQARRSAWLVHALAIIAVVIFGGQYL